MFYVYRCPNVVKWHDRIMMHNVNVYLPNIYQSLSLSLFKRRAIQNENLTDFAALRLRYLSQSNSTLFKVTRFIYYKVNSKNMDNLSEILCTPASPGSISLDLLIEIPPS